MALEKWSHADADEDICFGKLGDKAASVGRVRNSSLACTSLAFHRIDFVSCQHRLLHRGKARSVAGRAGMLFDLRRHDGPFRPPQLAASFIQTGSPSSSSNGSARVSSYLGCTRSSFTRRRVLACFQPPVALIWIWVRYRADDVTLTAFKYRHGRGQTTDLPRMRGLLDPSAASRRQRAAHVPMLRMRSPRSLEVRCA